MCRWMYILRIFSCFLFETSIAIFSGVLEIKLRAWVGGLFISDMAKSKRVGFLNRAKYRCACIVCIAFLKSSLFLASPLYADIFSSDKDKMLRGS